MFLVLKKRNLLACGLLCCFFAAFAVLLWTGHSKTVPVFAALGEERVTLVIDPGHGGGTAAPSPRTGLSRRAA